MTGELCKFEIRSATFMFSNLTFGLSSVTCILTKVMHCLVKLLVEGRDKKFLYTLATVSDPSVPPPPSSSLHIALKEA